MAFHLVRQVGRLTPVPGVPVVWEVLRTGIERRGTRYLRNWHISWAIQEILQWNQQFYLWMAFHQIAPSAAS